MHPATVPRATSAWSARASRPPLQTVPGFLKDRMFVDAPRPSTEPVVSHVLRAHAADIETGAVVVVSPDGYRVRRLPLLPPA